MASPSKPAPPRAVATNRQARRDYEIVDTYEAGIVLQGSEVKSLREAKVQLAESYARIDGHEIFLVGLHISAYSHSGQADGHLAERQRKLLLHRGEIERLNGKVKERGLTLVPLRLYFKNGRAKIELALARGKKQHDKREAIREREQRREIDRELAVRRRR